MAWIANQHNTLVMEFMMVDVKPADNDLYTLQAYGTYCPPGYDWPVELCEPLPWELAMAEFQRVQNWLAEGNGGIYRPRSQEQIQMDLKKDQEMRSKWQDMYGC